MSDDGYFEDFLTEDYITSPFDPTPDELPQDKATCHFCRKGNPDQFFMEGFWAHDTCMDAQYDAPNPDGGTEG